MDLLWLVIPGAIVLFIVRTLMIARSLKAAAANPTLADIRGLRAAKRSLGAHKEMLEAALGQPSVHLDAAKRLAAVPKPHAPSRASRAFPIPSDEVADGPASPQ